MCYLKLTKNSKGHALVELSATIPFFLSLIFMSIEYTSYYKDTQNAAFYARELANGGLRYCSEDPTGKCFEERFNVLGIFSKQYAIGNKASQELELLSNGTNWPYALVTVWANHSTFGPTYAFLPLYIEGRCPPYIENKSNNSLDANGTRCPGDFIPYPRFGPSIAEFEDLILSKDYVITTEVFMWHRQVTPLGKVIFTEEEKDSSQFKLGPSSFIYQSVIF